MSAETRTIAYSVECDPSKSDDWWHIKRAAFGGDDGVEFISLADIEAAERRLGLSKLGDLLTDILCHDIRNPRDRAQRKDDLEKAEKTFLAIRGLVGNTDEFRLYLGHRASPLIDQ